MEKLTKILKNVLLFLAVFLIINYIMQSCQSSEEEMAVNAGNIVFQTTENEYSKNNVVTVEIKNFTEHTIEIANECPEEPLSVYKSEANEWVQKTSSPDINCEKTTDIIIGPGEEIQIPYISWNHTLFSEMGRFKIEFETEIGEETKTFTTNEFIVGKEGVFSQLWKGVFYRPIYNGLIFLTKTVPGHDLGLAIILLTLIIRTILLIPSQKSMKAQKRMQEVQPRLEKIKQKYKGDQQKIAAETMAVWKEAKVNPFGSCLPLLLQLPFLIALFYVIKGGLNPDNSFLLYVNYENFSLADINTNFLGILDLTKPNIYVLPLIVGGLQFAQMKLSMAKAAKKKKKGDKQNEMAMATNMMTYFMPVMIAVFTATFPAGVGIYWGTSTFYGVIQQLFVNKSPSKSPDEPTVKVIS